jgi:hypothetical protein
MQALISRASDRLHPLRDDRGGAATGVVVAVLILAGVAVAAFFYFGGEADVDIKNPEVTVTSDETPSP